MGRLTGKHCVSWMRQQHNVTCIRRTFVSQPALLGRSKLPPSMTSNTITTANTLSPLLRRQQQQRWFSARGGSRMTSAPRGNRNSPNGGLPAYVWIPVVSTVGLLGYSYYAYLDEVPLTHRKRWIATSPEWEAHLGDQEYRKLLAHFQSKGQVLPPDHRASMTVQRVGSSIAQAAQKFAREHDTASHRSSSTGNKPSYTYTVVRSDMANAFVLPNNHVFVMTGLFRYIQNEDDLAAVIGHEFAHNLARHAGEKMSSSFVINLLARLSLLVDPSGVLMTIFVPATTLLRDLPHSRTQETEADQIGLYLAAEACYDPRAAKRVFAAMKQGMESSGGGSGGGVSPPEFLSTHPSHDSRISNFDDWLPDAMKVYQGDTFSDGDRCRHVRQQMQAARKEAAHRAAARERFQ